MNDDTFSNLNAQFNKLCIDIHLSALNTFKDKLIEKKPTINDDGTLDDILADVTKNIKIEVKIKHHKEISDDERCEFELTNGINKGKQCSKKKARASDHYCSVHMKKVDAKKKITDHIKVADAIVTNNLQLKRLKDVGTKKPMPERIEIYKDTKHGFIFMKEQNNKYIGVARSKYNEESNNESLIELDSSDKINLKNLGYTFRNDRGFFDLLDKIDDELIR
jgi:hypothetical protein